MVLMSPSSPVNPFVNGDKFSSLDFNAGTRISVIKVLFPEPLTPVTATKPRRGTSTLNPFRLFALAPKMVSLSLRTRRSGGTTMLLLFVRYAEVNYSCSSGNSSSSWWFPENTTSPPNVPAMGPMSTR